MDQPKKPEPERRVEYIWRPGSRHAGNPQVVGAEIMRIARQSGLEFEAVTATMALDAARDPRSPLHRYCEWNDGKAADEYRKTQLREIIRSIKHRVIDNSRTIVFPAFPAVNVGDRVKEPSHEKHYVPLQAVVQHKDLHQQSLDECLRAIEGYRNRYESLRTSGKGIAAAFRLLDLFIEALRKAQDAEARPRAARPDVEDDRPQARA